MPGTVLSPGNVKLKDFQLLRVLSAAAEDQSVTIPKGGQWDRQTDAMEAQTAHLSQNGRVQGGSPKEVMSQMNYTYNTTIKKHVDSYSYFNLGSH